MNNEVGCRGGGSRRTTHFAVENQSNCKLLVAARLNQSVWHNVPTRNPSCESRGEQQEHRLPTPTLPFH